MIFIFINIFTNAQNGNAQMPIQHLGRGYILNYKEIWMEKEKSNNLIN
jgi:hypothetical protein